MFRRLPTVNPRQFQRFADTALILIFLIVLTGAGVRLTGSGLGCPDWPKCHGSLTPPLNTHSWIEFGNRLVSALVGLVAAAAGLVAWRRRPFRRDLALIGLTLPLGVLAQGTLGAFTVIYHLRPGFVMAHFGLSMILLIGAVALAWRARYEPGERPRLNDKLTVYGARALAVVGAWAIFLGTIATASGPHSGGHGTGDSIDRLDWKGIETLDWAIHWHGRFANLLGICTVIGYFVARRRGGSEGLKRALLYTGILILVQGAVGGLQYWQRLPAELVWIHVVLSATTWIALLYVVAVAGSPRLDAPQDGKDLVAVGLDDVQIEREPVLLGERGEKPKQIR
jgi:cytochrome c oxidase assembly protein subunit 15